MLISQVVEDFESLILNVQSLCDSLVEGTPIWLPLNAQEQAHGLSALQKAKQHLQDFWYQDGQDGRETRSCYGLIGVSPAQLQLIDQINQQKDHFKQTIQQLQKQDKSLWHETRGQLGRKHHILREQLRFSGLSRLHLKQTWRRIPVTQRPISRVGFNWYHSGRSIQKISAQQAYDALNKLDSHSSHIQAQLSLVGKLKPDTPLARVQKQAPVMRANLFYDDGLLPERQAMNISLPLFYLSQEPTLPSHNVPEDMAPGQRKRAIRSDRKIEDEPFLPSIRVHRYQP